MSLYSGTHNLFDELMELSDGNISKIIDKTMIEIGVHGKFLNIKSSKEAALYFPNQVIESCKNDNGTFYIKIEQNDYMRKCETQQIEQYVKTGKRERQYCKKMRVAFVPEEAYNKCFKADDINGKNKKDLMKILRKIRIGGKQKYNKIRLTSYETQRKVWLKELVAYGYDEEFAINWIWCFGKREINYK